MKSASNWLVTKDKFITPGEIQRLYESLKDGLDLALQQKKRLSHVRDYYVLKVLLETGLRVFELTQIKVADICDNVLVVRRGKNGKCRNVLLTKTCQRLFQQYIFLKQSLLNEPTDSEAHLFLSSRGACFTTRGIRKRVKYWFSRSGLRPHLSVHSCRHTAISNLLAKGVDLATIRDNAGHSSLAVTSIYSHVVKQDLDDIELYSSAFVGKGN